MRLTIDDVAQRTGLTAHTLRYYERIGLIQRVSRGSGGQRLYATSDLAWVEFLVRLRATRMSIGKMLEFARLRSKGDETVSQRRQMLETHLLEVEANIHAMQQAASSLAAKIENYRSSELRASEEPSNANPPQGHGSCSA